MLNGLLNGLIVGWILAVFGFEPVAINSFKELFNIVLTTDTYYFIFALIGLVGGAVHNN